MASLDPTRQDAVSQRSLYRSSPRQPGAAAVIAVGPETPCAALQYLLRPHVGRLQTHTARFALPPRPRCACRRRLCFRLLLTVAVLRFPGTLSKPA